MTTANAWIDKYIFPNSVAPSQKQIATVIERTDLILEDVQNFGTDYGKTLMDWNENFDLNFEELQQNNSQYDERFYRMFRYYLLSCAGAFRAR
jgi:cyclopropane-fatty-acyl-phospholipid synthase